MISNQRNKMSSAKHAHVNRVFKPPDGGWGWVVVFASFMMNCIIWGILNTSGIIYVELLEYLQTGKGETAWISSLTFGTSMAISPVTSVLSNTYGDRCISIVGSLISTVGFGVSGFAHNIYFLYISLGLVVGVGFGLIYLPFVVCLGHYFEKRRSFALGLSVCGTGVGTFIWAPVVRILIDEYGWRGTTLILTGVILNLTIFSALLRPPNSQYTKSKDNILIKDYMSFESASYNHVTEDTEHSTVDESKELSPDSYTKVEMNDVTHIFVKTHKITKFKIVRHNCFSSVLEYYDFSLFRNPVFLIFLLSNFSTLLGLNAPYVYLPDRAQEKGISKIDSAFFISIIGVTNTFGRIIFGWLADRKWVNRIMLCTVSLVISGIITILNPLNDSREYLIVYSAIYGFFMGVFNCLYVIVLVDLLGLQKFRNALGIVIMVQGMGSFIGPPAAGWLYDVTGSYNTSFYGIGTVLVVGGVLLSLIPVVQNLSSKEPSLSSSTSRK